jgi:hypothetical protein
MKYEEAILLKNQRASTFKNEGITYRLFVTPEKSANFLKYVNDIRAIYRNLTDDVAIKYSTNGEYILRGLNYNGVDLLFTAQ